ncbi:MAG: type II secretion system F family protein [Acidaminococcaceae bacterium]|nr:type II secretion system F family protein [Acidaminococcaceae bacterium]
MMEGGKVKRYRWRAKNRQGENFSGEMLALNNNEVAAFIQSNYGYVTEISPKVSWQCLGSSFWQRRKLTAQDKVNFFRQLATLVVSGIPLLRALELLKKKSDNYMGELCCGIEADLEKGLPLSGALAKRPRDFAQLTIHIVQAGETSGQLEGTLAHLADYYESEMKLRKFLRGACLYPCFILVMLLVMLVLFIFQVLPLILNLYQAMEVEFAPGEANFISLAVLLTEQWPWALVGGLGLGVLFYRNRALIGKACLHLPLIKKFYYTVLEARFCKILGIMLRSGVVLPLALEAAQKTLPQEQTAQTSQQVAGDILRGLSLSQALGRYRGFLGQTTMEFLAIGEESGQTVKMLLSAAQVAEEELHNRVKELKTLLEPVIMLSLALIVGGIIYTITSPLFKLVQNLPEY